MVNVPAEHDATLLDRLRLQLVPGIGPRLLQLLLEHVGEATEILAASRQQLLAVPRIGPTVAAASARATGRPRSSASVTTMARIASGSCVDLALA